MKGILYPPKPEADEIDAINGRTYPSNKAGALTFNKASVSSSLNVSDQLNLAPSVAEKENGVISLFSDFTVSSTIASFPSSLWTFTLKSNLNVSRFFVI